MDQLTLKPRKAVVEVPIENWDDDDLDFGADDLSFGSSAPLTAATTQHRESVSSSRMSIRSDWGSNQGDDERQVHLPGDDERSTTDAIAMAKRAGIPIPENVPSSALLGGTIKKLGGKKIKKVASNDWDWDDLELPADGGLKIKQPDASNFPDELRKISGGSIHTSPSKPRLQPAPKFDLSPRPELKPKIASRNLLDEFRDQNEGDMDDDDFGGNTLKVSKIRGGRTPLPLITPPTPLKTQSEAIEAYDDFEEDLQFPKNGEPFKLSTRREIPRTPAAHGTLDIDDWAGGSLGTRFGGTRRDGRSNRSSSASALSPSVASSLTVESEDEGLDGLVLPTGPIAFDDILKRRQQNRSPDHQTPEKQAAKRAEVKEDFMTGLEIGDGDVFDSGKLTLNRNVKMKTTRQTSPTRPKAAVSLTFTNKPTPAPISRLPRPLGGHDRAPSSLEPVSESGGPIASRNRRSQSRIGHSAHSSITSIGTPTTPSASSNAFPPSTPRRRDIGSKQSNPTLRNEPTTTNAQLLKLKRSMPTMRSYPQSPAKPMARYERPPSRSDTSSRAHNVSRPKTPVERDRSGAESSLSHARRNPMPFLPAGAGAATNKSHHVTITTKTSRHFRRNDSESSNNSLELRPSSRAVSRSTMRSPSPKRNYRGAEFIANSAAAKRTLTKPVKNSYLGTGRELDEFDDLPTSHVVEKRFVKEPVGRGPPKLSNLRPKIATAAPPSRTSTPAPLTPYSPARMNDGLPRFARDTTASRMAREYSLAQRAPSASGAPLATLTNQWKAKVAATTGLTTATAHSVRPKKAKGPPQKPHLIKPLGNLNNPKSLKGMYYNPQTFRWEGNENELSMFDAPASSPSTASIPSHIFKDAHVYREKENTTPRPALIQNVNSAQNVQVVGGMVFDPTRMCWLKMPTKNENKSDAGDTMDGFDALDDEEEDVFKDVPDLEDTNTKDVDAMGRPSEGAISLDDWLVGEEFDVGPEFVRRQREEEDRWRRKCEKWITTDLVRGGDSWRWSIRDVVNEQ
ncbi:hypothetical protein GLAREA_09282 [Glarea lozoyensis ATCC 20868]|uniref:Cytokinesis inhibitor byr4 n=1 Tax=Glarea lozoyensis (strain ATCC 20868 / MF5171) TaxID=1116229 RepID=S3DIY8_GLAL2|nr:uncharacterized protein GLAREA_09282 [Glarea lozoyensis ATCC 20868]EPE37119.1 hypothetical protein GLAREA_09282 [Glarea lozoyensis ATCC 20868]